MIRAVLLVAVIAASVACKGDHQKCETACRNAATLLYWRISDAEIAKAPPEGRDALRKRKLGEFASKLENGVDLCLNQCVSAGNDSQIDCLNAAKTAADVDACTK